MLTHSQEAVRVLHSIIDLTLQAYLALLNRQFISEKLRCLSLALQANLFIFLKEKFAVIIFVLTFPYLGLLYFALGFQTVDMGSDELDQHRLECLLTFYWIHFHYSSFLL